MREGKGGQDEGAAATHTHQEGYGLSLMDGDKSDLCPAVLNDLSSPNP